MEGLFFFVANGCLLWTGSFPETHHHHLLGSQRLSSVPCLRTGSVCGARGTQSGQPPASVPAGHRQRPARGEGRGETEHAFSALLLCHQCVHPHHQGEEILRNRCVLTATAFHCGKAKTPTEDLFSFECAARLQPFSCLCSSPQSLTPTTSVTLSAIPQLGTRGCTAP